MSSVIIFRIYIDYNYTKGEKNKLVAPSILSQYLNIGLLLYTMDRRNDNKNGKSSVIVWKLMFDRLEKVPNTSNNSDAVN